MSCRSAAGDRKIPVDGRIWGSASARLRPRPAANARVARPDMRGGCTWRRSRAGTARAPLREAREASEQRRADGRSSTSSAMLSSLRSSPPLPLWAGHQRAQVDVIGIGLGELGNDT